MPNQYINKVIYGGDTLIDLTGDNVSADKVLAGTTLHLPSGQQITTTSTTGIPSKTGATYYPSSADQTITANQYLSGAQIIKALAIAGLTAANIKKGITVTVGDSDDPDRVTSVTGTYTSDATAAASEILKDKTAYANGSKVTGTMVNNGAVTGTISTKAQQYTIPIGYHDGSGKVSIATAEQNKIIAANIREGVTILGVAGSMSGSEDIETSQCSVTPYTTAQTLIPTPVDPTKLAYYSQVNVAAIYYNETDNNAGGKTVTIGQVAPTA